MEEKEDAIKTVSLEFYGFAIKRQKDRTTDASGGYKIFLLLEFFVVPVVVLTIRVLHFHLNHMFSLSPYPAPFFHFRFIFS